LCVLPFNKASSAVPVSVDKDLGHHLGGAVQHFQLLSGNVLPDQKRDSNEWKMGGRGRGRGRRGGGHADMSERYCCSLDQPCKLIDAFANKRRCVDAQMRGCADAFVSANADARLELATKRNHHLQDSVIPTARTSPCDSLKMFFLRSMMESVPLGVDLPDVARVEPSFRVDDLRCHLRFLVVSRHHGGPFGSRSEGGGLGGGCEWLTCTSGLKAAHCSAVTMTAWP